MLAPQVFALRWMKSSVSWGVSGLIMATLCKAGEQMSKSSSISTGIGLRGLGLSCMEGELADRDCGGG